MSVFYNYERITLEQKDVMIGSYAGSGKIVRIKLEGLDFPITGSIFKVSKHGFCGTANLLWRIIPDSKSMTRKLRVGMGRGYNSHNEYAFFYPTWMIKSVEEI